MDAIVAIDQGTTATKALVVDADGAVVAQASAPTPLRHPRPGWAENDPHAIVEAAGNVVRSALSEAGDVAVRGVGITNQRETTVLWDRATGKALTPAVSWQDRRTSELCRDLRLEPGAEALVRERTGLVVDPYFSGTKVRWLLDNDDDLRRAAEAGDVCFGTMDTWLVAHLTGRHVTDPSNASRTLLYDIGTNAWDGDLLDLLQVPIEILPTVVPSSGDVGTITATASLGDRLPELDGVPVAGIAGDQQASLFGHGCLAEGQAKGTLGTGAFFLANAGRERPTPPPGVLATVAWDLGDGPVYALEAASFSCGSALEWLGRLGVIGDPSELDAVAATVPASDDGPTFVPALFGLAAPAWDPEARAAFLGMSADTTAAHLALAAARGLAAQNVLLLEAMERAGVDLAGVRLDGGVSRSDLICQLMADAKDLPVSRTDSAEVTAMGAAYLAGLATDVWTTDDVGVGEADVFTSKGTGVPSFLDAYRRAMQAVRVAAGSLAADE